MASLNSEPPSATFRINPKMDENAKCLKLVEQNQNKTYDCKECHKVFPTVSYLREHMNSHINTCWICDKTFSVMEQLILHLKNCSKQQKSMYCEICDKTFEFPALYKQHQLIYHPEGQPCLEALQQRLVLVGNMQGPSNCDEPHFCEVCHKEVTTTKNGLKIHMQQCIPDNKGPIKCNHCPRYYTHKIGLMSHYRVEHPPKRVSIPDSSIATITHKKTNKPIEHLLQHQQEHSLFTQELKRLQENYLFTPKTDLVSSMKSEPSSPEPPYVNLEDDKFTVEETEIKTEELNVEMNNPLPAIIGSKPEMVVGGTCKLKCSICGKCFLTEAQLTSHIATHVRKYMCKLCDKSYFYLSDYESHITHCSQMHMQWHNGNELFSCEICGKRFITKGYLAIHLKTHTEDELLTCPSKQVVTNEIESSIAVVTRRKVKKNVEEQRNLIIPESDCIGPGVATVVHEKVTHKNFEEQEDFILPESDCIEPGVATVAHEKVTHKNFEEQEDLILPESDCIGPSVATVAHENNGNELFSCEICGKRFITKGYLAIHLKTHTEDELLTCPSKQVVTNEIESSIAVVTRRKVKKKNVEEQRDLILPESDCIGPSVATVAHEKVTHKNLEEQKDFILPESDCIGPGIITVAHKKVIHRNLEEQEDFILPGSGCIGPGIATVAHENVIHKNLEEQDFILPESGPVDRKVPVIDKEISKKRELTKLVVYSVKSEPSNPKSCKSIQKNHSSSFDHFILPESDPVYRNVPARDKESFIKSKLNELLVYSVRSEPSNPKSCKSRQKNCSLPLSCSAGYSILLQDLNSPVKAFAHPNVNKKAVFNGKLVRLSKIAVDKLKKQILTNHIPNNKRCSKLTNSTKHCRMDHPQKKHVRNEGHCTIDPVKWKRLLLNFKTMKKLEPSKHHIIPESNPDDRNVTVSYSYEELCEKSEQNNPVDSAKIEPSSPESTYVNLHDEKFTIEENEENTEELKAEFLARQKTIRLGSE